jgi:hypothetical protein
MSAYNRTTQNGFLPKGDFIFANDGGFGWLERKNVPNETGNFCGALLRSQQT